MGDAWRLAGAIQTAEGTRVLELAGVFREEYLPAGDLRLYLLGLRDVDFSAAMPGRYTIFGRHNSSGTYTLSGSAPQIPTTPDASPALTETILWALPGTLRQMWNCRLDLHGRPGPRLGGDPLFHGPVPRDPAEKKPAGRIIPAEVVTEDFSLLPHAQTGRPELERLAILLRPARWGGVQEYDPAEQIFSLPSGPGGQGHSSQSGTGKWKAVVDVLERLVQEKTRRSPGSRSFWNAWRENGRLCLYPIECFTNWGGDAMNQCLNTMEAA